MVILLWRRLFSAGVFSFVKLECPELNWNSTYQRRRGRYINFWVRSNFSYIHSSNIANKVSQTLSISFFIFHQFYFSNFYQIHFLNFVANFVSQKSPSSLLKLRKFRFSQFAMLFFRFNLFQTSPISFPETLHVCWSNFDSFVFQIFSHDTSLLIVRLDLEILFFFFEFLQNSAPNLISHPWKSSKFIRDFFKFFS